MDSSASNIEAIRNLADKLKTALALNIEAFSDLQAIKAKPGVNAQVTISNLMIACRFNRHALGDVEALKAKLDIKDVETDGSAEHTSEVTPVHEPLDPPAGETTEAGTVTNVNPGEKSGEEAFPVLASSTPYRLAPAQLGLEVTSLCDALPDNEPLNPPDGPSTSNPNDTTPETVVAEATSASNLWPENDALKTEGAKIGAKIYRTKNCNSIQEARALLEEVWSEARTCSVAFDAERTAIHYEHVDATARLNNVGARYNRLLDAAYHKRRSFEERIGKENWTELVKFNNACEAKEGDVGADTGT